MEKINYKKLNKNSFILIVGANGFIGKNLYVFLKSEGYNNILCIYKETDSKIVEENILKADIIFHFAGVNRPDNENEFNLVNVGTIKKVIEILENNNKTTPIVFSSSTKVYEDNEYGKSKIEAENFLIEYSKNNNSKIFIFRFPNVFGKWSKPNYNSVVATFCYNISRNLPINISDEKTKINLLYIDDLCIEMKKILENNMNNEINNYFYNATCVYEISLLDLSKLIYSFKESREKTFSPLSYYKISNDMSVNYELVKKIYSTYLSFLSCDDFSYNLNMNKDDRGSFTEIIKTFCDGQFSINVSKPGIIKGGHFHNTKNEKFIVVSGKALVEFKNEEPNNNVIISYELDGDTLKVIDIPCGYSHTIINIGSENLVTLMWANEVFDKNNPDTFISL